MIAHTTATPMAATMFARSDRRFKYSRNVMAAREFTEFGLDTSP